MILKYITYLKKKTSEKSQDSKFVDLGSQMWLTVEELRWAKNYACKRPYTAYLDRNLWNLCFKCEI